MRNLAHLAWIIFALLAILFYPLTKIGLYIPYAWAEGWAMDISLTMEHGPPPTE